MEVTGAQPATEDEVARVRRAYDRASATLPDAMLAAMDAADLIPDAKPLRKLAKVWEAMRPADRAAVSLELARLVGFQVEADELDVGLAARAAAENVDPDGRKVAREPGFDHAVTVAARIWVERGNKYYIGNFHRPDKPHQTYPMQVFIADLIGRALPVAAIAVRTGIVIQNGSPKVVPTQHDHLRLVDSSLRLHDGKLLEASGRRRKRSGDSGAFRPK